MKRIRSAALWFVIVTVIYTWTMLWQSTAFVGGFQADSEGLVVRALREKAAGTYRLGGFMMYELENERVYTSQYGLQHKVLYYLRPQNLPIDRFIRLARLTIAALFALTLAVFVMTVRYEFDNLAAGAVFGGILASPWLAFFAPNLYWVIFIHFLPFVAAWALYPRMARVFWLFAAVIAFLVFIKSLSGYEFLSNIILSPVVPLLYYELKNDTGRPTIFKRIAVVLAAGAAGFGGALALHATQSRAYFGTAWRVINDLTAGMPTDTVGGGVFSLWLKAIPQYIIGTPQAPGVTLAFRIAVTGRYLLSIIPFAAGLLLMIYAWSRRKSVMSTLRDPAFRALFIATAFAYLASFSWMVLGAGHFAHHPHVDSIIFYLPADLMAFVFVPIAIRKLLSAKCAPA